MVVVPSVVVVVAVVPGAVMPGTMMPGTVIPAAVVPSVIVPGPVVPGIPVAVVPGAVIPGVVVPSVIPVVMAVPGPVVPGIIPAAPAVVAYRRVAEPYVDIGAGVIDDYRRAVDAGYVDFGVFRRRFLGGAGEEFLCAVGIRGGIFRSFDKPVEVFVGGFPGCYDSSGGTVVDAILELLTGRVLRNRAAGGDRSSYGGCNQKRESRFHVWTSF